MNPATPPPFSSIPLVSLYTRNSPFPPEHLEPTKDSYFVSPPSTGKSSEFPHGALDGRSDTSEDVVRPRRRVRDWRQGWSWTWSWSGVETAVWAAVPLVLFAVGFGLLCAAMFDNAPSRAFLSVVEVNGTGRLDYYIFQACATASGSTRRMCTPLAVKVDFVPALTTVSPSLLGFSSLQLPFRSTQTPSVFISSLVFLVVSTLLYVPLWTLAYFPHARLPSPVVRLARYSAATVFDLSGLFALLSFVFTLTIGVGVLLQSQGAAFNFTQAYRYGALASPATVAQLANPEWVPQIGGGFKVVWAACTFSGLAMLAVKVSVFNGMDERVEWPADEKR
ncbi:hypothetical protein JCM9279_003260 [Rhodotorula babjevae]